MREEREGRRGKRGGDGLGREGERKRVGIEVRV